jgi:hypothetical protein
MVSIARVRILSDPVMMFADGGVLSLLPEIFYLCKKQGVGKKVLIIENDQDIRHIVEFILGEQGFTTLSMPEPESLAAIVPFAPRCDPAG